MHALISPNEKVRNGSGDILGDRVAEVTSIVFPVASPLFWVDCADDVVADQFYCADGKILPVPQSALKPEPVPLPAGGGPAVL
jgi:hypothetical protein